MKLDQEGDYFEEVGGFWKLDPEGDYFEEVGGFFGAVELELKLELETIFSGK